MNYKHIDRYIANYVKDARTKRCVTMQEIADNFGITRSAYCRYEHAERSMPSDFFRGLCNYLKIDHNVVLREAQDYMIKCFNEMLDD